MTAQAKRAGITASRKVNYKITFKILDKILIPNTHLSRDVGVIVTVTMIVKAISDAANETSFNTSPAAKVTASRAMIIASIVKNSTISNSRPN